MAHARNNGRTVGSRVFYKVHADAIEIGGAAIITRE
jgi:hypothetical protein